MTSALTNQQLLTLKGDEEFVYIYSFDKEGQITKNLMQNELNA